MATLFEAIAATLRQQGQNALADLVLRGDQQAKAICQAIQNNGGAMVPMSPSSATPTPGYPMPAPGFPGAGGCGGGACGLPSNGGGCNGGKGSNGGCGCGGAPLAGNSGPPNGGCNNPVLTPVGGCPIAPSAIPPCSQVGSWNCQAYDLDLAPCDISRIEREDRLVTISNAEIAGPLADGADIAALIVPIGVSHDLCIEELQVQVIPAMGDTTTMTIGQVSLQAEGIYQAGGGEYVHAWDYEKPERPSYINVTDSRCKCADLCVCIPAEARARVVFLLTEAVAMGATLSVTVWGRRTNWGKSCGPCPPCMICDRTELTDTESGYTSDTVYAIP
jgi:hypothetical protein